MIHPDTGEIVVVVEQRGSGGIAHYAYNLAEALAERASVILATAVEYELEALPRRFRLAAVMRPSLVAPGRGARGRAAAAAANVGNLARLVRLVQEEGATVVHLQGPISPRYEPTLFGAARACGGPVTVTTVHDVVSYEHRESSLRTWGAAYGGVDGLVAHSRFAAGELLRVFGRGRDIAVIPHGDYSFFRGAADVDRLTARAALGFPPDRRLLLFFGYVKPYKGLDLLADAWARAVSGAGLPPDVDLVVAGQVSAESRGDFERLEREGGVRVHCRPGYVPTGDVAALLSAADAVVLPYRESYTSGLLPLAFSFALPVVATRVGSLGDEVRHGVSGLLAAPDDPDDLARRLVEMFAPGASSRLAAGAAAAARERSWTAVADKTLAFYGSLRLRSGGKRRHD